MSDRIPCCVPFCRRTRKPGGGSEWICARHWPMVPITLRKRHRFICRVIRREVRRDPRMRTWWEFKGGSPERLRAVRIWRLEESIWKRCKESVMGTATGI